jgi:hypothetical protein
MLGPIRGQKFGSHGQKREPRDPRVRFGTTSLSNHFKYIGLCELVLLFSALVAVQRRLATIELQT